MAQFRETGISSDRASELREKIQDDSYLSTAIEQIAEMMTRELFPEQDNLRFSTSSGHEGSLGHKRQYLKS